TVGVGLWDAREGGARRLQPRENDTGCSSAKWDRVRTSKPHPKCGPRRRVYYLRGLSPGGSDKHRPPNTAKRSTPKESIFTDKAPKRVGAYSQAVKAGGFVFVST